MSHMESIIEQQTQAYLNKQEGQTQDPIGRLKGFERFSLRRVKVDTLQGRIYDAVDQKLQCWVVVKETFKSLIKAKKNRSGQFVAENFEKECEIHTLLSNSSNCSNGIAKLLETWEDSNSCFNAMEACEMELFTYISTMHGKQALLNTEDKSHNEWITQVTNMFQQMVKTVSMFHQHNICHLDLSLENAMIKDIASKKIKIIDFGLAEQFTNDNFKKRGRAGKVIYMAPEVYDKQEYDARSADIWSLGVILFIMLIGAPVYEIPHRSDTRFKHLIEGKIKDLLIQWNRLHLITEDALDLLNQIFRPDDQRITMDELLQHPFINSTSGSTCRRKIVGETDLAIENLKTPKALEFFSDIPKNGNIDDYKFWKEKIRQEIIKIKNSIKEGNNECIEGSTTSDRINELQSLECYIQNFLALSVESPIKTIPTPS